MQSFLQTALYLKLAVAIKVEVVICFLVQGSNTAEVAAVQQAIPDSIRDQSMCPPEVNCSLIVIARVCPCIACKT